MQIQAWAQCNSGRYISELFAASRTHENVLYNKPLQLQGACLIESNTDTAEYFLDVYEPDNDTLQKRPVIVYAHGGAFLIGERRMVPIEEFCTRMAKRGFVVVSIDYRKCFNVLSSDGAIRAVYRAVQDMKAAIRFVKNKADEYRIDTNMVFAGGNSAGSIMAIHAAYADEVERSSLPATYNNPDLGCLECSGNSLVAEGKPKALLNFWGAIVDTVLMRNNNVPMLSVHGMADVLVFPDLASPFSYPAFPPLYGSEPMVQQLNRLGVENEFHYIPGVGHEPWLFNCPCYVDSITEWSGNFLYRVMLQPKIPQVNYANTICQNDTVIFSVNNAENASFYCWQIQGGNMVSHNANFSEVKIYFANTGNAQISLQEKNKYEAISEPNAFNLNIYEYPVADAGEDQIICLGDSAELSLTGGTTFQWLNLNWMQNVTVRNPTVYPPSTENYIAKTDNGFCIAYDTVTVTVNNPPAIIAKNEMGICEGDTAELNVFTTGNVQWQPDLFLSDSDNDSTDAFPLVTTKYIVTATENGCSIADTITVKVNSYPAVPLIVQSDSFLTTASGFQYQWFRNDTLLPNSNFNIINASLNGAYKVAVTNAFGCTTFSEPFVYEKALGIASFSKDLFFQIIPNPSNGWFAINTTVNNVYDLKIWNTQGQIIAQQNQVFGNTFLDISTFTKGIYFCAIQWKEKYFYHKIIIQ